jgi:hypothetical protein
MGYYPYCWIFVFTAIATTLDENAFDVRDLAAFDLLRFIDKKKLVVSLMYGCCWDFFVISSANAFYGTYIP